MKLFDWLLAGPKAAEKVLDATVSGLDKLVLTEEERHDMTLKAGEHWIELQKLLGEETTVRGMTRRILAVMCTGVYILLSVGSVVVWKFDKAWADFMWEVANAGQYGYITLTIIAFYFGPYFLKGLFSKDSSASLSNKKE